MNDKVLTDAAATRAMEPHARPFRYREGLGRGRARLGKEENMSWGVGPAKTSSWRHHGGDLALLAQKWREMETITAQAVGSSSPRPGLCLWESLLPVHSSGLQRAAGGKCLFKFFPQAKG